MRLALSCITIILLGLILTGCDKKPVDIDEDKINSSGTETTFQVLSDCDDHPVIATQENADYYCEQYGYQRASRFETISAWCGSDGGNSNWLYKVTCWKPL